MRALWAFLLVFFCSVPALAAVQYPVRPPGAGYVNDFASVLSSDQKVGLEKDLRSFERTTQAEFAVVTVPTLQGQDVADYANGLFRSWGIGKKGADNGVLLLVSTGDRKVRIEVGYRLESILTDADSKLILHDIVSPEYRAGDRGKAIIDGAHAVMNKLSPALATSDGKQIMSHAAPKQSGPPWWIWVLGIVFIIVLMVITVIMHANGDDDEDDFPSMTDTPTDRERSVRGGSSHTSRVQEEPVSSRSAKGSGSDFATGALAGAAIASSRQRDEDDRESTSLGSSLSDDDNDRDTSSSDSGVDFGGGSSGGGGASDDL